MNTQLEYINILQRFKKEYAGEFGITSIGLFGSVARNEHTVESDVDVLVEAPVMSIFTCMDIKKHLEEMMGVPVDVIRKSDFMRPRFKARIEKEVIYV
ncbi:MAG: nucleotidyltransferase family protein [Tannerella sp.]|jgi:predicted nucleotidyltransferase|nr:nucleotidyltransferase family protein [Tannerella sp.]